MFSNVGDRVALHELAARYGDVMDDRNWAALADIFTADAVYDVTASGGGGVLQGLRAIQAHMASGAYHPRSHNVTNIYVAELTEDRARLRSRAIGVLPDGTVIAGRYDDEVVRVSDGWRIFRRTFTLLRS